MKATLFGLVAILMTAALSSCGGPTAPTSPDVVRGTGSVRFLNIEGGFFAIRGDDGVTYDPTNLPAGFQRDNLRVRFEARILRDRGSFHMVGPLVDLTSIAVN